MGQIGLEIIQGVMGSGKTYYAVEIILGALKEGAQVHTNIPLRMEVMAKLGYTDQIVMLPKELRQMKHLIRAGSEQCPNLLVLDEAQTHFSSEDQADVKRRQAEIFEILVMARRYGLEMYFISQSSRNLSAKIRRMSDCLTKCINLKRIPYFGWALAWRGEFRRTYYITDDDDKEIRLTGDTSRFRQSVGDAYDTHSLMDTGIVLNKYVTRKKPFRKDQLIGKIIVSVALTVLIAASGFTWHVIHGWMTNRQIAKKTEKAIDTQRVQIASLAHKERVLAVKSGNWVVTDKRNLSVGKLGVSSVTVVGPAVLVVQDKKTIYLSK